MDRSEETNELEQSLLPSNLHAIPTARRRHSPPPDLHLGVSDLNNDEDGGDISRTHRYRATWLDHTIHIPISSSPVPTPSELSFVSTTDEDLDVSCLEKDTATRNIPNLESALNLQSITCNTSQEQESPSETPIQIHKDQFDVDELFEGEIDDTGLSSGPSSSGHGHDVDNKLSDNHFAETANQHSNNFNHQTSSMTSYEELQYVSHVIGRSHLDSRSYHTNSGRSQSFETTNTSIQANLQHNPMYHNNSHTAPVGGPASASCYGETLSPTQTTCGNNLKQANLPPNIQYANMEHYRHSYSTCENPGIRNNIPQSPHPSSSSSICGEYGHVAQGILNGGVTQSTTFRLPMLPDNLRNTSYVRQSYHTPNTITSSIGQARKLNLQYPDARAVITPSTPPVHSLQDLSSSPLPPPPQVTPLELPARPGTPRPLGSNVLQPSIERELLARWAARESTPGYENRSLTPSPMLRPDDTMRDSKMFEANPYPYDIPPPEAVAPEYVYDRRLITDNNTSSLHTSINHFLSPTHSLQVQPSVSPSPLKLTKSPGNRYVRGDCLPPSRALFPSPPPIPDKHSSLKATKRSDRNKSAGPGKLKSDKVRSVTAGGVNSSAAINKQQGQRARSRKVTHVKQRAISGMLDAEGSGETKHRRSARLKAKTSGM